MEHNRFHIALHCFEYKCEGSKSRGLFVTSMQLMIGSDWCSGLCHPTIDFYMCNCIRICIIHKYYIYCLFYYMYIYIHMLSFLVSHMVDAYIYAYIACWW